MGSLMRIISVIIFSVIMCFSYITYFKESNLFLVSYDIVPVYKTKAEAISSPPKNSFSKLLYNERVQVIKCVDVKHYQIYKVRLLNGEFGYVNEGKYVLLRDEKQSHC